MSLARIRLIHLICALVAAFSFRLVYADEMKLFPSCNYFFLTEDEGLPNGFVSDIIMDSRGFVWAATHGGISRYDGYGFLTFTESTPDLKLKNRFVNKLCEDAFGRLWIATDSGLDIADLLTCKAIDVQKTIGALPNGLESSFIGLIYRDNQERLWLSAGNSLYCLSFSRDGKISRCHTLTGIESKHVHSVVDWNGTVCVGLDNNIYVLQTNDDGTISSLLLSETIAPFSEDWEILSMVAENEQTLWIGTNRGLFRYNSMTSALDRYRYSNHRPGMLSQAYITDLSLTASGKLIVSTRNGLNVYHPETDTFEYVRHDNDSPLQSINCNAINCLFTCGEDIWAGTETGGINLLTPKSISADVMHSPVNAIGEDRQGNVWVGIVEGGLNYIDVVSQSLTTFKFDQHDPHSISNNMLTGIFIDSDNHLWAYTWGVGINELNLNFKGDMRSLTNKFIRHIREDSLGLESDFLSGAYEDTLSSVIWFATTRGLHYYRKSDNRFTRVLFPDLDNQFESVGTLLIDNKRRLWMPTSQGVFILDINSYTSEDKSFEHVWLKSLNPELDTFTKTNSSFRSSDGTIWIGSDGSGLFRLMSDAEGEYRFVNYTVADGLPDNNIFGITEDASHRIWIATGYGLSCLDTEKGEFTNYTQDDGLPGNQFYRNTLLWSSVHDKLFVGTTNGMAVFTPPTPKDGDKGNLAIVSSVSIAGRKSQPASIDIHERQKNIVIEFTNLSYGRQNRVRYAWRLGDGEWRETQPGVHSVQLASMPSGKYMLQLKSTDENGHWNSQITEFPVKVHPYFFKTAQFIIAVLICIVIAFFIIRRIRKLRIMLTNVENSSSTALNASETGAAETDTQDGIVQKVPQSLVEKEGVKPVLFPSRDEELLNSAYTIIASKYADTEYGVDEFVRDLGFSKTWINQRLQDINGSSIGQFMKAYRLSVAKSVLDSDTPVNTIADLALSVGFSDPKYFSRCFKAIYGVLPSDLLKKPDSSKKIS